MRAGGEGLVVAMLMGADDLRALCHRVRDRHAEVDGELLGRIEAEVERYRAILAVTPEQQPPAPLDELLPLMGWLIYEASLAHLRAVPPAFMTLTGSQREAALAAVALTERLSDAARRLPWPEYAPRALGAIRVSALIESKRDTEEGYDAAWALHEEARVKYDEFRDSHGPGERQERFVREITEVLLPLTLAETGTACRAAERVLGLWADELAAPRPPWTEADSPRWTQRMFRELSHGATVGELALATAEGIEQRYRFVHRTQEHGLSLVTSYRNPAIMTCRALLLLYSMCPEMRWLGRTPEGAESWPEYQRRLIERFEAAFAYLRREVTDESGVAIPLVDEHRRTVAQLCLHLALVAPGHQLAEPVTVDDGPTVHRLDHTAVETLSAWLASTGPDGEMHGDANTIGSASKPSFIASVIECRGDTDGEDGYRAWRRRWPQLDRYAGRPGRGQRVERALATTTLAHADAVRHADGGTVSGR